MPLRPPAVLLNTHFNQLPISKFFADQTIQIYVDLGCFDDTDSRGHTTNCLVADVNVQISLASPITLQPVEPEPPYQSYFWRDTCTERSGYPTWKVEDLLYEHARVKAGVVSTNAPYKLSFNLTNFSNGERLVCSLGVDDTFLDRTLSEHWADCVSPSPATPSKIVSTSVMFNRDYNVLAINQTWTCAEG